MTTPEITRGHYLEARQRLWRETAAFCGRYGIKRPAEAPGNIGKDDRERAVLDARLLGDLVEALNRALADGPALDTTIKAVKAVRGEQS